MPRWLKITGIGCGGLLGLFILVGACAAIVGGPTDTPTEPAEQQEQQEPAPQEEAEQEPVPEEEPPPEEEQQAAAATIGEEVVVGDVSYTVHSAQPVTQLDDPHGFQEPLTGNFILVTFTFANNGNEPVTVSDIGLYLYDSQGREFETDADAAMYLPDETSIFLLDRVNPGLTQEVQTVYEVPPDAEGFELEVTSGFFASESARISLGF